MFKKVTWFVISIAILGLITTVFVSYQFHYVSKFEEFSINSKILNENRKVFIRLPDNYDANKAYPLIIRSDGNFNFRGWHESLVKLSQNNKVEDSILVSIPNLFWTDTRNRDLVPTYARKDVTIEARPPEDNGPEIFGRADLFLSFIELELLPHLESTYAINDNRILSGYSAGGSFVLYSMVTKPGLFTGYFAFSPAAWYDDSVVVEEFSKTIAQTQGRPIFFYLSLGGDENEIITGSFEGLLKVLENQAPTNLFWQYNYSENADHGENPVVSVPIALTKYYEFRKDNVQR